MSLNILILDPVADKPYSDGDLDTGVLGGTEATVLRMVKHFSTYMNVYVAQSSRVRLERTWFATYLPYEHKKFDFSIPVDIIIVIRSSKVLYRTRDRFPSVPIFLWLHCFPGSNAHGLGIHCSETDTEIIAVSDTHKDFVKKFIEYYSPDAIEQVRIRRIYNPVSVPNGYTETRADDKLIFLSSPHKGLDEVLYHFEFCRRHLPQLTLHIADPGYFKGKMHYLPDGVVKLGNLSHSQVIKELSSAFCLFYPQCSFAETFGLVLGEANAVGIPVIAGNVGANAEIISGDREQIINDLSSQNVLDLLLRWRAKGRPKVHCNPLFTEEGIAEEWKSTIYSTLSQHHRIMYERKTISG